MVNKRNDMQVILYRVTLVLARFVGMAVVNVA